MKFALLVLTALAFVSFGQYFEITNDTGYDIYFVYISESSDDAWGEDMLGSEIMYDGDVYEFDVSDLAWETDLFDIQLEDVDGDTYTFVDVDGEDYGTGSDENVFTVTLSDLD